MTRVVSLFLPSWPIERTRRQQGDAAPPAEAPFALVGREGGRQILTAVNAPARAAGLRPGLPAITARSLVPQLLLHAADADADADALGRLGAWLLRRYAPIVALDPPDGIVIDSTGADHLHGGEAAMLASIHARLARAGISARAAVAGNQGAAHALARHVANPLLVVPEGADAAMVAPLPLAALRLPAELVDGLQRLGFVRVADLMAQPRAPLTLRFGPEPIRRLDQALGRVAEPISPMRPAGLSRARIGFAEPISTPEAIAHHLGVLAERLCEALEAKGRGARRLDLLCQCLDGRTQAVRAGTAQAVRDARRIARLFRDRIENIDPGAGIEIMSLSATITERLGATQAANLATEEAEADLGELIDVLANHAGTRGLYRIAPVASDVPERSVRRIPALAARTGATWPTGWPRPARLLAPPERIETVALLPDHPPVSFTWRGIRRRVRRADGPERVFGEWWKRDGELNAVRDYFRVEDDGGERFWIFRSGDGEDAQTGSHLWFLHGMFG